MGVLDAVLTDAGSQLGLSSSSMGSVLAGLLSFINHEDGGLKGFLGRFRRAGVGDLVTSWLSGDAKAVSVDTVENALGHDTIDRIGSKAGLSFSTAASAIALMLPKLIQRLAPGGAVPTRLSADIASYISGPSNVAATVQSTVRPAASPSYLWPLLGLLLLGALVAVWLSTSGTPTTTVPNVAFNVEDQVRLASARAATALAALRPGFTARDLVSAMNLQVINFATGSAEIPAASRDLLNSTVTALKAAPAGTTIEIGGHTDSTGDPAANATLSQQRADAVRDYLVQQGVNASMLTARGYGQTAPLTTNDTEEGRFRNRRIEFTVR